MRNDYSTPTVSFADRSDFRPRVLDPFRATSTYHSKRTIKPWTNDSRGFFVSVRDMNLMSAWLRGKM